MPSWNLGLHESLGSWPYGPGSNLWTQVVSREASILGRSGQVGHLDPWKSRGGDGPKSVGVSLPLLKKKPHNWGGVVGYIQEDWLSQETKVF